MGRTLWSSAKHRLGRAACHGTGAVGWSSCTIQRLPQGAPAAGPGPSPQAGERPPADQVLAWCPSPGGPLFATVCDATAVAEEVRHHPPGH